MLPSLSALRGGGRAPPAPVGQSVATRAGARLFGKWLRRPRATGVLDPEGARSYDKPGFDDYFNWCTSDNPDLGTAPEWYRSDKAAVLCAVEKDGLQLRYASPELRDDEQVVRLAFIQTKAVLGYVSEAMKKKMRLELFMQKHSLLDEAKDRGEYTDEQLLRAYSTLQIMHDYVQEALHERAKDGGLNVTPPQ